MPDLQLIAPKHLALEWRWRDKHGQFHSPAEMETRHLFYVLRMIWNHCCPIEARVGRSIRFYRFSPFYTAQYMRDAVRVIWPILDKRKDLTPMMEKELHEMRAWFGSEFKVSSEGMIEAPKLALMGPSS